MLSILSRYNVIALSTTTSTKIRQGIANQRQTLNGGINVGWTKSPLSPRLKFRGVSLRLFSFSFFLQSSQPPTRPATCHVKINRQSSWNPPFFQSTCGVFCLPVGPYLTACRPTFFLLVSLCLFGLLIMVQTSSSIHSLLKMAAQSTTKMWRVLTCDRTRKKKQQHGKKMQSSSWVAPLPRD